MMKRLLLALALGAACVVPASADYVDHISGAESGGSYSVFNTIGRTEAMGVTSSSLRPSRLRVS